MKQTLLFVVFCLLAFVSVSAQTLTNDSEVTLSTDAIYSSYRAISWGDITGADKLDVVGETSSPDSKYVGVISDLTGTAVFTSQDHIDQEDHNFYGSSLGDLDNDGDLDFITAGPNGATTSPNNVYYWDSTASQYEKVGSAYSIGGTAFYGGSVVIGDFTNDSKNDVAWIGTSAVYLGVNSTTTADDITFSSISSVASINTPQFGNTASDTGDFNGDGNLDIIITDNLYNSGDYGGYYQLLLGNGDGTFTVSIVDFGTDNKRGYSVASGDVNNDGYSDFVLNRSNFSSYSSEIILYTRNDANTGFDETTVYTSDSQFCRDVTLEDVDKDSYPDLLFQSDGGSYITIYLNNGDGTFNETADLSFYTGSKSQLLLYDIDDTGYNEIVTIANSKVSYFKVGYQPDAPTANDQTYTYDGTEKSASATAPENSTLTWYTTESGSTTTTAPTATDVGIYTAYAAAIDDESGFESERTLVTLTITEDQATAINELTTESISVYPNPATSTLNIEGSTGIAYVYNLAGTMVLTQDLSQSTSMDISDLTNGVYLVKVDGEIIKVVKK